jgi:CubicO group peptidase (beta-lactamase class C family)
MSKGVSHRLLLAALLALSCLPALAQAPTLHSRVEQTLQQTSMAGAVWATVDANGDIETGAAGVRNALTGEPMTPDSKVHVGSIAKALIASGAWC